MARSARQEGRTSLLKAQRVRGVDARDTGYVYPLEASDPELYSLLLLQLEKDSFTGKILNRNITKY